MLKFVPAMLTVSPALPGATLVGERLLAEGTGLLTVNVATRDGAPPGFATVTNGVPATAMALAGMAANNCVGLAYAEETMLEPNVTIEDGPKPDPLIVRVNCSPPAVALAGSNPPIVGCEFGVRTVSVTEDEVPPPPSPLGGIFVMVMLSAPTFAMSPAKIAVVT